MFKMTPYVLRNFISPKATRRYPREVRAPFEDVRGQLYNEIEKCTFCSICAVKCPSQCITVDKKAATWTCDPFACVYCGICVESCPAQCLHQRVEYRLPAEKPTTISMQGELKKKITKPGKEEN